jgi:spore coat protein CotH
MACGGAAIDIGGTDSGTIPDTGDTITDTGEPTEDTDVEDVGGVENLADWVFDQSVVHRVDINMSESSLNELRLFSEPYDSTHWVEASLEFDGHLMESVGVRLKGRGGSWRSIDMKAGLKIDINRYVNGQNLYGLETLTLNNMVVDYSFVKEQLAYMVYEAMEIPYPRNSYAEVYVNGELYGLYLNIETPDEKYLDRFYDDNTGNLYDADYLLYDNGGWDVLDFYESLAPLFELEEGTDVGGEDISEIADVLTYAETSGYFMSDTEEYIDWDYHTRMMATEMWVGQNDGYSLNRNNYLVYFDPSTDLVTLLPWDHDYAFLRDRDWGFSWLNPIGRLSADCVASFTCREMLKARIRQVSNVADGLGLAQRLEDIDELIRPYIIEDPRKEAGMYYVDYYQTYLYQWISTRSEELEDKWGL